MIPYDDLVVALATWRARQGLPVGQLPGAVTPAPRATPPPTTRAASPAAPGARTAPPHAPPSRPTPPPLASPDTHDEQFDDASLLETQYENEGDDFSLAFGNLQAEPESTAIGRPPPGRQSEETILDDVPPMKPKGRGRPDW